MSGAGDDAAAACCGICCLCGFGALSSWCNTSAFGAGRGGGSQPGCCGSCCNKSFNEDSMDKWDKDRAELRAENQQPEASRPMSIPSSTDPSVAPAK
ncbi:hypothetical protein DFH06DRAFT_96979 [Mycena polygramma]|nr:hypothetical protein DFH06DRAFT_746631 [Mycena polygramma]KAJ7672610.1 hypothetical protein DFH06DRAFT_96979 [Mycena polygramma]